MMISTKGRYVLWFLADGVSASDKMKFCGGVEGKKDRPIKRIALHKRKDMVVNPQHYRHQRKKF